jgi:hypothetical protein
MMLEQQGEARLAAPSAAEPLEVLLAPLVSVDQAELVEPLAALELVARPVLFPDAHRFVCATQPTSR